MNRRNFIQTMIIAASAPVIIPIQRIMPVKHIILRPGDELVYPIYVPLAGREINGNVALWGRENGMMIKWCTRAEIEKIYGKDLLGYAHLIQGDAKKIPEIFEQVSFRKSYN